MRRALLQFLMTDDGAATLDWAWPAASLATLLVVSFLSATGSFAHPDPSRSPMAASAAVTLPAPAGLGS